MALSKLNFKPGINKEVTRYSAEGGWYDCDKVRFRQGFPEKIGGWIKLSENYFLGVCRSIFTWSSNTALELRAVGTHLKLYIESGGAYTDITPIRETTTGSATFSITDGESLVTVEDTGHLATVGDFVTFSGAVQLGTSNITADVLNKEYQIFEIIDADSYSFIPLGADGSALTADATVAGGGGASTEAAYQINIGSEFPAPANGWSAGLWGNSTWGNSVNPLQIVGARVWSFGNFGEDLIAGPKGGGLYYWSFDSDISTRATAITGTEVPLSQNILFVSDIDRFVFVFGTNAVLTTTFDPMLIRWSDQESYTNWSPSITNQAGSLRLSRGSKIKAVKQARQEILVWTNQALYSLQYLGPPIVWGSQIIADNITITSQNAVAYAAGLIFWMGEDQFFTYSGRVETLPCTLQRHVFSNINRNQLGQIFSGTNEKFGEVWWFYCSENSSSIDSYVIYNYVQQIWYNGSLSRTAWENKTSVIAATYNNKLVIHEFGNDDFENTNPVAISAHITSAPIDIEDGDRFSFVWRVLPDLTFRGSNCENPSVNMTILAMKNAGSGYIDPASEGGVNTQAVSKVVCTSVEEFTEQVNIRVRGRQLVFKIDSDDIDTTWQLGSPRIDVRTDGKR